MNKQETLDLINKLDFACEEWYKVYNSKNVDAKYLYELLEILAMNGTAAAAILRMAPPPDVLRHVLVNSIIENPKGAVYLLSSGTKALTPSEYDRFFKVVLKSDDHFSTLISSFNFMGHNIPKKYWDSILDRFVECSNIEWLKYIPFEDLSDEQKSKLDHFILLDFFIKNNKNPVKKD